MATTPEGKVKEQIKAVLKKNNAWYFMPVQNGMGRSGIPDFIVCYHGRMIGVEAKAPSGTPTYNQLTVGEEIKEHGGEYIIARSGAEVQQYFDSRGDHLKEAVFDAVHREQAERSKQ